MKKKTNELDVNDMVFGRRWDQEPTVKEVTGS